MLLNLTSLKQGAFLVKMAVFLFGVFMFLGQTTLQAASVYENQEAMKDEELASFIKLLPQFRAWAVSAQEEASPTIVEGKADFMYSEKAADWVRQRGWDPRRFFSVMGKAAAGIYLLAEGSGVENKRSKDMPTITEDELNLVSRYLSDLLNAGSDSPPINR